MSDFVRNGVAPHTTPPGVCDHGVSMDALSCPGCAAEEQRRVVAAPPRRRVSFTARARIYLVLTPLVAAVLLLIDVAEGVNAFGSRFWDQVKNDAWWWYREVYRPARYGSRWDD